jgi:hypothetical protein
VEILVSRYVTISADEWSLCVQVANARQVSSIKKKGKDTVNKKQGWLEEFTPHIIGCVGEMAVAKALGVTWTGSVDTFKTVSDLSGNIQVRHRSDPRWDLIVRKNDSDSDVFILSRGMPPGAIEVVGKIRGGDAKREEWLQDKGGYGRPAYFVPSHALEDL